MNFNKTISLASLLALAAILIWSTLALSGSYLKTVPPFLVLGVALSTSGLSGITRPSAWRVPLAVWLVGIGGIFGNNFLYFRAFAMSPAVEVNLVNYSYPLLIVALSPLVLPGYGLHPHHIFGALTGFAGVALIATGGRLNPELRYLPGYLMAGGAAITWALYSLMTHRLPPFPTRTVGAFCAVAGVFSLGVHFLLGEGTGASALGWQQWLAMVLTGVGPMGASFLLWDAALKRGDPRRIASLAFLTPLLSTLNLVVFAGQSLTPLSFAAMGLIILGAVIGSR